MDNKELIYVGDPMCSWCYGFSAIKVKLEEQCRDRVDVRFVAGGLRPYNSEIWKSSYQDFLREHWTEVGQRTGKPFCFNILQREDFVYDTEPPCRAAVTARKMGGEQCGLDFFSTIQKAFYAESQDVTQAAVLIQLADNAGLGKDHFSELFRSEEMKIKTAQDFQFARDLGVTGFPTVVLKDGETYDYLTVGYQAYDRLEGAVEFWLQDKTSGHKSLD